MNCRRLPLLLLVLLTAQAGAARAAATMPPSVVLVLKLVSSTRVKPATGVVVSAKGEVLVAADFIAGDGEIVVLDGGADIGRHGRPATVIAPGLPGGLGLLSVAGLERPVPGRSMSAPDARQLLHLAAFPPAEYIAGGAEPIWAPARLTAQAGAPASVSPETPLPWVTGPLIDACGQLAGMVLADGAQSLATGRRPAVVAAGQLGRLLAGLGIDLPAAECAETDRAPAGGGALPAQATAPEAPGGDGPVPAGAAAGPEPAAPGLQPADAPEPVGQAAAPASAEPPAVLSRQRGAFFWLLVAGLLIAGVVCWRKLRAPRPGRPEAAGDSAGPGAAAPQPASGEPATLPLDKGSHGPPAAPRPAPREGPGLAELDRLPAGCDGLVAVSGRFGDGAVFERHCPVDSGRVDLVIGRGAAGLSVEDPTVSRAHARLKTEAGFLTLSDLGSGNGTFIRGIPCLRGEVMYLQADDDIVLGDVRLRICLLTRPASS